MALYFNAADNAHLALLPQGVRSHSDIISIAAMAEAMVIGYYTENPPYFLYTAYLNYVGNDLSGNLGFLQQIERGLGEDISATGQPAGSVVAPLRVMLAGYKADSANAQVDPNLKSALRQTIAGVIRWLCTQWGHEPGLSSASGAEGKARQYKENAEDAFQPDWNMLLKPYEVRPVPWGF